MKKRIIALALAAVMVVLTLGLASCTGNGGSGAKNGTLTVGFDATFPPMGFKDDNGNLVGFDLDLAAEVAKRLDMKLELKPIVWDSKDSELKTGGIDLIWNGFTMNGREDDYTWSEPYMRNNQVIVVNDNSTIASLDDLKGKKLALQAGSSADAALNDKPEFKASLGDIVKTEQNLEALNELKTGMVDAVLMDETVAAYNIAKQGGKFKIIGEPLAAEEYGVGFLKGNTELRDKVQAQLEAMAKDGTLAKISNEWFGKDVTIIGK
ncbi:MAG: amino acid ABC transporter substrate-binding protein [Candidatus Fimivicinus sp.]|nr:amino acid ABC transporter substrate-binding protein [Oscillospiraceae bacterium]MDY5590486.1 amino acid ABC transporter substrate-binding protein [Candidatus Fimivicinus sp.]